MKPLVVVGLITACLVAGVVGASVAMTFGSTPQASAAVLPMATPRAAAGNVAARPDEAERLEGVESADLANLRDKVDHLEIEVASLRETLARRSASETPELVAAKIEPEELADVQREAIVQVLEEQRQKEQDQREQERKQRELEAINRMAERAAKDLGLGPADQQRLADFMVVANDKRTELFRGVRDNGPEGFRTAFDDYRTWRDSAITDQFGAQLGQQLIDYQNKQREGFMGGGGWGGGGGPGGGGPGGATESSGNQSGGGRGRRGGG